MNKQIDIFLVVLLSLLLISHLYSVFIVDFEQVIFIVVAFVVKLHQDRFNLGQDGNRLLKVEYS